MVADVALYQYRFALLFCLINPPASASPDTLIELGKRQHVLFECFGIQQIVRESIGERPSRTVFPGRLLPTPCSGIVGDSISKIEPLGHFGRLKGLHAGPACSSWTHQFPGGRNGQRVAIRGAPNTSDTSCADGADAVSGHSTRDTVRIGTPAARVVKRRAERQEGRRNLTGKRTGNPRSFLSNLFSALFPAPTGKDWLPESERKVPAWLVFEGEAADSHLLCQLAT